VEIVHANGVMTRYAHLRSAAVAVGAKVVRGETIAAVGSSGITTGPHLHYEVLVRGRQVDPLRFRIPQDDAAKAPTIGPPSTEPPVAAPNGGAPEPSAVPTEPSAAVMPAIGEPHDAAGPQSAPGPAAPHR
jgi:murein DD-endopeptidase MepM/ murein hydrolase activator NlpD